ncbi:MAG TPA: hypothetical protein VKV95_23585 [Terriglobia bacterium]|nr:hypothetical protein [Terriglobia bacterium]
MIRFRRLVIILLGLLGFIAGMNLAVPALGWLAKYYIYARPRLLEDLPAGSTLPASPVFGHFVNSFLGLILAAAGIALVKRYR